MSGRAPGPASDAVDDDVESQRLDDRLRYVLASRIPLVSQPGEVPPNRSRRLIKDSEETRLSADPACTGSYSSLATHPRISSA